jgi:two-component system, NarL family, response regulator DevR
MRILLIGEHALLLQALMKLLHDEIGAEVRTVARLPELESAVDQWDPDLAVLETTNVETIHELITSLASLQQRPPVLVIAPGEREQFLAALRAGARGFVGRHVGAEELLGAIQAVQRGEWGIPRAFVGELVTEYLTLVREQPTPHPESFNERERRILTYLAHGMSAQRIGEQLFLSASTVRGEIRGIVQKLRVANRTQAVAEALRRGLLLPEE